ncbi:MAG: diguanylate cyclase [Armatimonadetes bacterium]|nr:diguanylate cyclase [Armatimonadota bacterium]
MVAALFLVAVGAIGYASILSIGPVQTKDPMLFRILFGVAALIIELLALETPYLGYASLAVVPYAALGMEDGPRWALWIAGAALLARTIVRNRQDVAARLTDFSIALLTVAAVVFAWWLNPARPTVISDFWHTNGLIAVGAMMAACFLTDFLLCGMCASMLDAEPREVWKKVRMRTRIFTTLTLPLAVIAVYLLHANVGKDDWISYHPMLPLIVLLPLGALQRAVRFGIEEEFLRKQDKVEKALQHSLEELGDYKNQNRALMADLQKRVDEITILFEMGQQLGASKDLNKTLEIIIKMIRRLLIYQSCVIYLVNEKGALVPAKCVSPYADVVELSPLLQLEESMVNLVVQSKKPVLVSDMQGDHEHRIFNDEKSIMCVPLIVKDDIIGVIYVGTLRPGSYTDDHVHILETLGNPAATAIKSAQFHALQEEQLSREQRLRQQANERNNQLNVLYQLGRDLNRSVKMKDILDIVVQHMGQLVRFQSAIIFISRPPDGQLVPMKVMSPYEGLFTGFVASPEDQDTVLGWVAVNKRHLLLADARESRFDNIIRAELSYIMVPLLTEDEILGVLYVGSAEPGVYDDEVLNLVTMVSAQAAMAIQKAALFEKTEGLAITDGVTGLYTHRYFQERLNEEVRWAERYNRPLSLIMVDTDHFKKFNDTLGHPEGDKLLKEIAALLRSYTRESDLVCRYGGDEFSLILKDTDKDAAVKTGERIREAFQLRFGKLAVKVTSSIGVSSFPIDARGKAELVTAADAALYRSKQGGRNRVSYATPIDASEPPGQPSLR